MLILSVIHPTACLVFSDYNLATIHCTGLYYITLHWIKACIAPCWQTVTYDIEICGMLTSSGIKTDDELHQRQTNMQVQCMTEPEVIKSHVFNSTILTLYLPNRNSAKMFEIVVECVCTAAAR